MISVDNLCILALLVFRFLRLVARLLIPVRIACGRMAFSPHHTCDYPRASCAHCGLPGDDHTLHHTTRRTNTHPLPFCCHRTAHFAVAHDSEHLVRSPCRDATDVVALGVPPPLTPAVTNPTGCSPHYDLRTYAPRIGTLQ